MNIFLYSFPDIPINICISRILMEVNHLGESNIIRGRSEKFAFADAIYFFAYNSLHLPFFFLHMC